MPTPVENSVVKSTQRHHIFYKTSVAEDNDDFVLRESKPKMIFSFSCLKHDRVGWTKGVQAEK
jgi:hypothetical protein